MNESSKRPKSKATSAGADEATRDASAGPFDVSTVKNLVELMAHHDLAEIDLRDGMQRVRIRRGGAHAVVTHAPAPHTPPPAAPKPAADNAAAPAAAKP